MVCFEEEGARDVDENNVLTVGLGGRDVVDGDDKRAQSCRGVNIGVPQAVEGSEALSSAR